MPCLSSRSRAAAVASILLLSIPWAGSALGGLGPENVAVIINEDSWASKAVANEFIALYNIPPANVIYVKDLPDFEQTDIEFLRRRILAPVINTLEQRGLGGQIDCIAWSADFPHVVDFTKDLPSNPGVTAGTEGSLTGLTYLYALVFADKQHAPPASYTLPGNNRYFRRIIVPRKGPELTDAQQRRLQEAARLMHGNSWVDAEATVSPLLKECPDCAEAHYYFALCAAHRGDPDGAAQSLRSAAECGWANWRAWEQNNLFAPLMERKDFKEAIEISQAVTADVALSSGFRNSYVWNALGERTAPDQGLRYLLSVMLAVTSGRGTSVPEALDALRAAAGADGTRPKGTFYFMRNQNIRSTVRDWLFPSVVAKLRTLGFAAELLDGKVPQDKPDVMGAVLGALNYDWKGSGSKILPGAICEDFTSYGGLLTESAGQTPLTSLIACGAAGSSGTVTEPLSIAEKFPSPFIHVHYARGCSLAEAYYQSVATPYQLLIVGDPLCAPWRRAPKVAVTGLAAGQTVKEPFVLKPALVPSSEVPVQQYELYVDGRRRGLIPPGGAADCDPKELLDGCHELRVVAVADGPIEERTTVLLPITVDKSGRQLAVSGPEKPEVPWDRPLRLKAEFAGAAEIRFVHNLRWVGVIHGEKGAAEIDPQILGQGPCRIQCLALDAEKKPMAVSRYIEVRVVPPAPTAAVKPPREALSEKGLLLTPEGGAPVAVADTRGTNWLSAAGVKEGQRFALKGYFDAREAGVYQFQISGNVRQTVSLDGRHIPTAKPALSPAGEGDAAPGAIRAAGRAAWTFVPIPLAKGLHRVNVSGVGAKDSILDIRFGNRGTQSIGSALKCVKPPAPPAPAAAPTAVPTAEPTAGRQPGKF